MKTYELPRGAEVGLTLASDEDRLPAILMVHGWRSNIFDENGSYHAVRELLTKSGYHCFSLSLRGHAGAHGDIGTVSREDHLADIKEAFGWLLHHPQVDDTLIGAFGTSYGAYLLSVLAPEMPIDLLALRAPALYPDEGMGEKQARMVEDLSLREWRQSVHSPNENLALTGIAAFKKPILFVPSGQDEQLPPQVMESYARAAGNEKRVLIAPLPEAHHRLMPFELGEFLSILGPWFESYRLQHSTS